MKKLEITILIATALIPIALFAYERLYKGEPTLSIEQSHKSIIVRNRGSAEAKIIDAIYLRKNDIYCMSNNNINNLLGTSVFKYEVNTDELRNNQIVSGSMLKLVDCKRKFCENLYLDSPLNSVALYIKYKGTGVFDNTKTNCNSNVICQKYFKFGKTSCKDISI